VEHGAAALVVVRRRNDRRCELNGVADVGGAGRRAELDRVRRSGVHERLDDVFRRCVVLVLVYESVAFTEAHGGHPFLR
jgi:hypothetical protein